MTSSRRDRAMARRTFLGFAAVFTAAGVVGSITTDDAKARGAFGAALAQWTTAGTDADAAATAWSSAQDAATDAAAEASTVLEVVDTDLLDDPATETTLQAALDALLAAGQLTLVSPGELTRTQTQPTPRTTPTMPEGRDAQLSEAGALEEQAAALADDTAAVTAAVTALETATAAVTTAVEAVLASAAVKGAAAEVPALASQETKDAYAAAVAALSDAAVGTPTERLTSYQTAWAALQASGEQAQSSTDTTADDSDVEPTYVDGVLVVNKTYALPSWYGSGLTAETSAAFDAMNAEASSLGLSLWIASGFRSYETQVAVYNRWVSQEGVEGADRHSARPGHSEHQSGLAFDLNTITEAFGSTAEGQWVAANAHRFGFIVRYPQGKEDVTGYVWEPWHLRYLGVDVATAVYNSGLSLEEYLGVTSSYD